MAKKKASKNSKKKATSKKKTSKAASRKKSGAKKKASTKKAAKKKSAKRTSKKGKAEATEAPAEEEASKKEDSEKGESPPEKEKSIAKFPGTSIKRMTPLQAYLAEVRRHSLLTREEEHELAVRYVEESDMEAAGKLVSSNLRLVVKIALEYYRNWMDLLDLIQEGNLGLMQAVKKFDPYRGIRLSTYSSFWIRAYILKFLMDNWRLVKIGTTQTQRKLFFNLKKEKERLEQFGFTPGPKMLAESLAVKESEIVEMDQRLGSRDESFDQPITEDGKQTREMVMPDEEQVVDEMVAEDEFSSIIRNKLRDFRMTLSGPDNQREAYIFDHRLMSEDPQTLQDVGEKFDISRERVRQLESRVIKNLREYLKQELPDFEDADFIQ